MVHPHLADAAVVSNHEFDWNFSCQAGVLARFVGDAWVEHLLPRSDDRVDCGAIERPGSQSIRVRFACAWLRSRREDSVFARAWPDRLGQSRRLEAWLVLLQGRP